MLGLLQSCTHFHFCIFMSRFDICTNFFQTTWLICVVAAGDVVEVLVAVAVDTVVAVDVVEVPVVLLNHQQMKWRSAFKQKWKGLRCGRSW